MSMSFAFNKCQCPLLWLIPLGVKICLHSWWDHYSSISWDRIRTITRTNTLVLSNIEPGGGVGAEGNVKSSSLSNFSRTQKAWSMHNCTSASSPHRLTIRIIALKEKFVPSTIASIKESPQGKHIKAQRNGLTLDLWPKTRFGTALKYGGIQIFEPPREVGIGSKTREFKKELKVASDYTCFTIVLSYKNQESCRKQC